jgi:hypothetical protein
MRTLFRFFNVNFLSSRWAAVGLPLGCQTYQVSKWHEDQPLEGHLKQDVDVGLLMSML